MTTVALRLGVGDHRIRCPACADNRKKKYTRTLSVSVFEDRVVWCCHHCGDEGAASLRETPPPQQVEQVEKRRARPIPVSNLSPAAIEWFAGRGISAETVAEVKEVRHWISEFREERNCIAFPYRNKRGGVYAAKIRSFPDKGFSCNGAPQTFFGWDTVENWEEIVIVEGEMDYYSFREAGHRSVVSVPGGGLAKLLKEDNRRMKFLEHHADDLKKARRVILCTDADNDGQTMAQELARRIGRPKCWTVSFPDGCKDANEVLMRFGTGALMDLVEDATPWPVSGLYDASRYIDALTKLYNKGLGRGVDTGLKSLDRLYSILPGQLTVVTGHPSNGKSELVDQITMHLATRHGWRFAVCSFENEPQIHISKLAGKYTGKPFFGEGEARMTEDEMQEAVSFVGDHYYFLQSEDDDGDLQSLESILDRFRTAVLRYGIRGAIIDPYNYIAKPRDQPETEWISEMLSRVRSFAQANGIHIWFVAHPTKPMVGHDGVLPVPKGHNISGSAAWWAKADIGLSVHRTDPVFSTETEVHVWKVRFQWVGAQGKAVVGYSRTKEMFQEIY